MIRSRKKVVQRVPGMTDSSQAWLGGPTRCSPHVAPLVLRRSGDGIACGAVAGIFGERDYLERFGHWVGIAGYIPKLVATTTHVRKHGLS